MSEMHAPARVNPAQQLGIQVIEPAGVGSGRMKTKAHQPERTRRHDLEVGALSDPGLELLGNANVSPYQITKTIHPVAPDDKPKLQRSEPAAQLDSPVAEVDDV